jgi:ABC-type sugar transport system substrate-binding protein
MKIKLMTSVLVMLVLLLSACAQAGTPSTPTGQGASAPERTIRIGMANLSLCCAYFIGMSDAVKQEASVYPNVELIVTDANGEAEKLTSDIEDLIAKKVDGIIISGAWLEAAPAALEAINKAGIPVVLVDRKLKGGEYTSYVGPDNFTIGQQNGRYIAERLGGQGRLVVLRGGPADNSIGLDRTNGVLDIVKQHAGIEVVMAPDFGGWSTDGGLKLMENMLATYDKIDAVFCENDSMCLGAQQAIADAGRTDEMFLVGVDGQKEALVQIMQGTNYAATGLNNSDQIGRAAFHRLMAILAGARAPKDTILPSPLITKENVQRYYNPDSVF